MSLSERNKQQRPSGGNKMTQQRRVRSGLAGGVIALGAAVVLSACSFGAGSTAIAPTAMPIAAPTAAPAAAPTVAPTAAPAAVGSLEDAQQAVIQIEAEGTFISPDQGMLYNQAGSGSGFIIDESGIAVTNNHVVTGAALLQVYVPGEDRPVNARVLGVSECSDLAVIDLEGDGYPYLNWYDGNLKVGLDVFAAGHPLGDREFTMTRGIISKARADIATSWASVDNVLEHDATINPGNSGGPLLNADGQVVGVNYAGLSATNQQYAISRDEALKIIDTLQKGKDVTSLGINGEAFVAEDGSFSGIWVASVASGSPADQAGVRPGDVVTKLERLVLATDGSMNEYCDILRSRDATDTLNIEVIRPDTQQVLEGQINGRELEETFSFAQQEDDLGMQGDAATAYDAYHTFTSENGAIAVEIPTAWGDTASGTWTTNGEDVPESVAMNASTDIEQYNNTWDVPGMFLGASRHLAQELTPAELLDQNDFAQDCTYGGREEYGDALYKGLFDTWTDCGGGDSALIVVAFQPEDGSFLGMVQVQVVSEADLEALDRILDSFMVEGDF
jgi:serine protease Do